MSNTIFDRTAPKKSANLSINADLLQQARQLNINLSQTLEQHLAEIIRQAQRSQWLTENKNALDEYNRRVEKQGAFSDGLRRFSMAQFDVYLNPNPNTRKPIPYLLDVQANLLDTLATRVVVPLILTEEMGLAAKHLNPQFKIKAWQSSCHTAELAGISTRSLGDKVASLKNKRDEIIAALDLLFTGI